MEMGRKKKVVAVEKGKGNFKDLSPYLLMDLRFWRGCSSKASVVVVSPPPARPPSCACCSDCCAICLEDFADAAAAADPLPLRAMPSCSHTFHRHCILKWLRLKDVCPVCRCQLPLEEGDEEEEEQARRSSRRRRANDDAWLALVAQHTRQRQD